MSNAESHVRSVLFVLLIVLVPILAVLVWVQEKSIENLEARMGVMERTKMYRGKDANGEEVWSAQVVEISLEELKKVDVK